MPTLEELGYAPSEPKPQDTDLTRLAALVEETIQAKREADELEEKWKAAKGRLYTLEYDTLPKALISCGYKPPTKITISGHPVELTDKFRCGQLEYPPLRQQRAGEDDDRPRAKDPKAALDWLDENGHGDIIRNQVVVTLQPGSNEEARELLDLVKTHRASNQFEIVHKRVVPWNTLAAHAREITREGGLAPLEKLGVRQERAAKVKS